MTMGSNFPVAPSTIVPTWATNGVRVNPGDAKRQLGWVYNSSTGYGEYPTMEWVNFESWNLGVWIQYFSDVCSFFQTSLSTGQMGSSFICAAPSADAVIKVYPINTTPIYSNLVTGTTLLTNTNLNVMSGGYLFNPPISGIYEVVYNLKFQVTFPTYLTYSTGLGTPTIKIRTADGVVRGSEDFPVYKPNLVPSSSPMAPVTMTMKSRWSMLLTKGSSLSVQAFINTDNQGYPKILGSFIASGSYIRYSWNNSQPFYNP